MFGTLWMKTAMSESENVEVGGIHNVRQQHREELKVFRREQSDQILNRVRGDVSSIHSNISTNEMALLNSKLQQSKKKLDILRQIRSGLALGQDHIEAYLSVKGGVRELLTLLRLTKDPENQVEAAACLTNIAFGNHKFSKLVAQKTGPDLVASMLTSNVQLQGQCAWAAGNICNDCKDCFLILKKQCLLPALDTLLQSPNADVLESATGAFLACTKYDDPDIDCVIPRMTKLLLKILKQRSLTNQCYINAMFCLSNICAQIMKTETKDVQKELFEVTLLHFTKAVDKEKIDSLLATAGVRCLGTITAFNDHFCQDLSIDKAFGQCSLVILNCCHSHLKKEFLWMLNNVLVFLPVTLQDACLDWKQIVIAIQPFVCLLDDKAVLALYLLCTLASKGGEWRLFIKERLSTQIEAVCCCGNSDLELGAKTLMSLTETDHTVAMDT